MPKKLTQQQIIEQFHSVHKERYDYSFFKYKGDTVVSTIICGLHGEFQQMPKTHKRGQGCPKCGDVIRLQKAAKRKITQEVFEQRCIEAHGKGRYDLSLAKYLGDRKKVIFICPIQNHGRFYQNPKDHWRGFGCPECANKNVTTEKYIKKAEKVHGKGTYDYSLTKYINGNIDIIIICHKHGPFKQNPKNHVNNKTICPSCSRTQISKNQKKLYEQLKENVQAVLEHRISFSNKNYCFVDIFIPEKNIIIEYYGDYWHCNPKKYNEDYYHTRKKMYAKDIWKYDKNREQKLEKLGYKVFIVWENDFKNNKEKVMSDLYKVVVNNAKPKPY